MAAEELMVVLKRSENLGFGFSLLGTAGLPHVIYDIVENSPAAESGEVEAGDVIVKVNGTDVNRFTTKEVLKRLRLSQDPVTLELKRDPKIKAHVRKYLAQSSNLHHSADIPSFNLNDSLPSSPKTSPTSTHATSGRLHGACHRVSSSDPTCRPSRIPQIVRGQQLPASSSSCSSKSAPQSPHGIKQQQSEQQYTNYPTSNGTNNNYNNSQQQQQQQVQPANNKARFEAYMMTGDLILNYSRTPQSSGLITSHAKKVDSLRDSPIRNNRRNGSVAPQAKYDSSPSSPTFSTDENSGSSNNSIKKSLEKDNKLIEISSGSNVTDSINKLVSKSKISEGENNVISQSAVCASDLNKMNNDISGCVSSSSSSSQNNQFITNPNSEQSFNNISSDNVDCSNNYDDENEISSTSGLNIQRQQEHHQLPQSSISSSSTSTVKSEFISTPEACFSVPTSPTSLSTPIIEGLPALKKKESANSVPTSPEYGAQELIRRSNNTHNGVVRKCDAAGFRTSRSEDHLQQSQRDGFGAVIPIDIDEDVNSSLNTLLDPRHDSEDSQNSEHDRIVWTYNAPIVPQTSFPSSNSHSSSISSSPQRSDSPASPTSVSSSVMSSNSSSKGDRVCGTGVLQNLICPMNGGADHSVSEAVSNISSPDYQDEDNLLSSKDLAAMAISDPSDSDSTILVSEAAQHMQDKDNNRIIIHVKSPNNQFLGYSELKDSEDELATLTEDPPTVVIEQYFSLGQPEQRDSSPPISDDGSDVDSLHSYHYSPKAVDMPSAVRLAKRLYGLDGFKKSDVSRHLSKNNDFSRAVADEYLKYFNFDRLSLDEALRQFLQQFSLSGETQERERVLVHFSKRYLDCNSGSFNSQDAVHTLTCAIMLLNTDLHGQNIGRKMTCSEFIDNLAELNDGENFPKDILKYLYQAIKNHPLEWALDEESPDQQKPRGDNSIQGPPVGPNPFLDVTQSVAAIEYKKGYVMRKCCYETNYKKTPFGKRSWKMFYCTLRDLVLYLHKDEHGFRKNQMSDNVHNAIRIHHALATKATDYTKKQHVFRLQTADQSEYLFQTSDSKELQSWIDTINCVCASFSAPPLEGGVGSQKRFQRPLLPSSHTKFLLREQLAAHEEKVTQLENVFGEHKRGPVPNKGLPLQNYKEKENYLQYELKRYKTYVYILSSRMGGSDHPSEIQSSLLQHQSDEPTSPTYQHHSIISSFSSGSGPGSLPTITQHQQSVSPTLLQQQQQQQLQQQQHQQHSATNRNKETKYKT